MPYISDKGDVYYLDLLVWRANVKLRKLPIFAEFAKALLFWTINPLEGWSRKVPLFEEDVGMEDEGDEDEEDGEFEENEEGEWFVREEDLYFDSDCD